MAFWSWENWSGTLMVSAVFAILFGAPRLLAPWRHPDLTRQRQLPRKQAAAFIADIKRRDKEAAEYHDYLEYGRDSG